MTKKPVNKLAVAICLVLILCGIATLFLPIFKISIAWSGHNAEPQMVSGLDIIRTLFAPADYASASEPQQALLILLNKADVDYSMYINSVNILVAMWMYVAVMGLNVVLLVLNILNWCGYRLSPVNVIVALVIFVLSILIMVFCYMQQQTQVVNTVLKYNILGYIGVWICVLQSYLYMMFTPKKRV